MSKINRFAASAAAFALAASAVGCSAPEAITLGKGTQTAMTIDGYDVSAGIFVYNEIYAYSNAAYMLYSQNGEYPSLEDVKKSTIENLSAEEWIQSKATDFCKDYVATEKEFEKIGGELTAEELLEIDDTVKSNSANTQFTENGVGEESVRAIVTNSYKQQHVFEYYYGLDTEGGCTEDELKEYFEDKTARLSYFTVSLLDSEGNPLEGDEKREIEKMVDDYIDEINAEKDDLAKMQKVAECEQDYNDYVAEQTAALEEEALEESGEEAVTTTTAEEEETTTTTTTTGMYDNEVTLTKYTTTTADESEDSETTTTTAEETDAQKAQKAYNDFVFNDLDLYKAEKYQYDDDTIYIIVKGDITERMTDDDFWTEDNIESLLSERYYSDFNDKMKDIAEGYEPDKNSAAFRKYAPFKLNLETDT